VSSESRVSSQKDEPATKLPAEVSFVLSQTPVALCYIDAEFRYRFVNAAWSKWTGIPSERAIGRRMWKVIPVENFEVIRPHLARALEGERTRYETQLQHRSGEPRWLRTNVIPEVSEAREVLGLLLTIDDITHRKNAELALQRERERYAEHLEREVEKRTLEIKALQQRMLQSERLRTTEELAASVVDAISNPLLALLGTAEMALEDTLAPKVALQRILRLGDRIESVLDSTLRLIRSGGLELELHSVSALCERLHTEIRPRARTAEVELAWDVGRDLPPLAADASLLVAALSSIVDNALHVTPRGGRIDLTASAVRRGSIVRFAIEDTGPGIPELVRNRILEPFFSTRARGNGLGLSIAQGIIHGHKGTLRFAPRAPQGTTVTVELPAGEL